MDTHCKRFERLEKQRKIQSLIIIVYPNRAVTKKAYFGKYGTSLVCLLFDTLKLN